MLNITVWVYGLNSVADPVDIKKDFAGDDLHKLFRQFEYWYFAQRALIAGPEVDEPEGGPRE